MAKDGGTGVRDPRRPYPPMPAGVLKLDLSQHLERSAEPA